MYIHPSCLFGENTYLFDTLKGGFGLLGSV